MVNKFHDSFTSDTTCFRRYDVYELMIKRFKIQSILGCMIHWEDIHKWLGCFQWVSRSKESVISYLEQKGLPYAL